MNLFTKSLAEGISTRILAGIITFVGIMVLVGWIAINEGGRMQAFEQRFEARSIERGANLFANNCSTCHGIDGRGIGGRAPGLNNPQLFGHDFFPEITAELSQLRPALNDLQNLPLERDSLLGIEPVIPADDEEAADAEGADTTAAEDTTAEAEVADTAEVAAEEPEADETLDTESVIAGETTMADPVEGEAPAADDETPVTDLTEQEALAAAEVDPQEAASTSSEEAIDEAGGAAGQSPAEGESGEGETELNDTQAARLAEINARLDELAEQYGDGDIAAAESAVSARIAELENQRNPQLQTAMQRGYNPDVPDRLDVVGWVSSLDQYIHTTLIHGRPGSENYWPNGQGMAAWSQIAGGPLRDDQLVDIATYIQNWDREWTLEDLLAVNQFGLVPLDPTRPDITIGEPIVPVGTNVGVAVAQMGEFEGNPQEGQLLYDGFSLGCGGCHQQGITGPLTAGTYTRIVEERLTLPEFENYTAEQYIVESILDPNHYIAPNYLANVMPPNFGERMSAEQLAHIVAYLESQDQVSE